LLPIAPLVITPAGPGGQLIAFLGRHLRLRAAPGPATA
jgi:hypothetical protein